MAKAGGSSRKLGRQKRKAISISYKALRKDLINKKKKLEKHIIRLPNDKQAVEAFSRL